ncbi:MAG: NAD(P)-binding protein [Rhizobiales bacterium]|nr:NAD(P)-binding protein [Hyphomicrobiales bacterium]
MPALRIAVIGAGTAGLAAACGLADAGFEVEVIERFAEPRPLGAGLLLQPTGLAALEAIGAREEIEAAGCRVEHIAGQTLAGRTIFDVGYDAIGTGSYGLGIHRGALFAGLYGAVQRRGIPIRGGTRVVDIARELPRNAADDASRNHAPLRPVGAQGPLDGAPFDLVVDASGLRSQLRERFARIALLEPYPYGAVWGIVRDDGVWCERRTLAQRYVEAHTMIGVLPVGRQPDSEGSHIAFFWSLPRRDFAAFTSANFARWQDQVEQLWPEAGALVGRLSGPHTLTTASYDDVVLASPLGPPGVVFIGDAAHATSPQLGQGANLGLIDAVVLATSLASASRENRGAPTAGVVADGIARYARKRRNHVRFYQWASRLLTPFFQSDARALARVRDLTFAPMARVPFLRRQMAWTLAGMKTGLLTHGSASALGADGAHHRATSEGA